MAAVRNAFDLLAGGAEQPVVPCSSKPKSKKNKKKGWQASLLPEATEVAPIAAASIVPAATEPPKPQTAKDAGQALEAAAMAASAGEWGPLAQQWTNQVLLGDTLYTDGSQLVDFKQVLLKCHALELLVEGCLERGTTAAEAPALVQLLPAVAHPAAPPAFLQALAQAVAILGQVCAADRLAPTPAAKRSAAAALGLVRRGVPKLPPTNVPEAPATALKRLGGELGRQEARLAGTSQPKELGKAYGTVLDLLCAQLDVLRPACSTSAALQAPEVAAALKPLEELRVALAVRLQEVQAPCKLQLTMAEQVAEAEAGHRKDDASMAGRLSEVEFRIASLEAELAALKREAGDLRSLRAAATQHLHHRLEAIRSGKLESGASAAEIAVAVQSGLAALEGLVGAIRGGGGQHVAGGLAGGAADSAALGQQVVAAEVPIKLLGAMQQVVELNLQQVHELGAKARFFRERLDKAIKQGEQAARLGLGDPKSFKQQRATAEHNVKEVLSAAEAAASSARAAVVSYRERLPVMLRLPSFLPPSPEYLAALEAKAAEAEAVLESIRSGSYVSQFSTVPAKAVAAAAPAAAARPPAAGGTHLAPSEEVGCLEARLAALEAENVKKDAQIAAMVSSATLEVPSPLTGRTSMPPAMLSSPASNKPIGPAAPIAPAAAPAASTAPGPTAVPGAAPAPTPIGVAAMAGAPVVTFSQALLQQPPQANSWKAAPPTCRD